jgi:hypothetical protein
MLDGYLLQEQLVITMLESAAKMFLRAIRGRTGDLYDRTV